MAPGEWVSEWSYKGKDGGGGMPMPSTTKEQNSERTEEKD